jgi:hypothetical protein
MGMAFFPVSGDARTLPRIDASIKCFLSSAGVLCFASQAA